MRKKVFSFSVMAGISFLMFGTFTLTSCGNAQTLSPANVRLNVNTLSLKVGENSQLKAQVSPKNYKDYELRWFSDNKNVAVVNEYGTVFGVGEGTATVTAAIGGGFADCTVTVSGTGGGGETQPYVILTPSYKKIKEGSSFDIEAAVYPADTTVVFSVASGANFVSVTPNGNKATVFASAPGVATINAQGSNGKLASCSVEIIADSGDGDYDRGVEKNLGYSGEYVVGATPGQEEFVRRMVADFNSYTGSSVSATVITWSEDKAADLIGTDPTTGPHIYPYASDQTLRLNQRNALARLGRIDTDWIIDKMGETALDYATLSGANVTVGYPFSSDNGYVMFYDKSKVSSPEDIDTLDELVEVADQYGYEVNYPISGGFYAAGALMTYTKGKSLYKITVDRTGSFTSSGSFNGTAGLAAARTMANIYARSTIVDAMEIPGDFNQVLATIADCSNVAKIKESLGDNFGVAPLPYVSETDHTRLGVFLGYKFYGINPQRASDDTQKEVSIALARYLTSEYCQAKRFQEFSIKPTVINQDILDLCANEPHIAALNEQVKCQATIPLTAVDSGFWDATMAASKAIKTAVSKGDVSDEALVAILADLDTQCKK